MFAVNPYMHWQLKVLLPGARINFLNDMKGFGMWFCINNDCFGMRVDNNRGWGVGGWGLGARLISLK
jgi:hypothetical protein